MTNDRQNGSGNKDEGKSEEGGPKGAGVRDVRNGLRTVEWRKENLKKIQKYCYTDC